MIENHLIGNNHCNTQNLQSPQSFYKKRQIMLGLTLSVGDITPTAYN